MIRIAINGKSHRDGTHVLGRISIAVGPAETVALFGPSGVGKTTLLHLLAGLDKQFQGQIEGVQGAIGYVFQSPRLLPWRTALQNLQVVAPDRPADELMQLLEEVDVGHAAGLFPAQLSLGMARRVAIARALAVNPAVLLLDEPFASLDMSTSERLRKMLGDLLKRLSIPTILVTHDPDEALQLADRVLVLQGRPATITLDAPAATLDAASITSSLSLQQT